MATPDVTVDIADFLSNPQPANKVGYLVQIVGTSNALLTKSAYTNSSGVATLSSVTPGEYRLQVFGLGIEDRVVTVPDEAGPLDASDLSEGDGVASAVPTADNPLVAGDNITLTQTADGLEIASTGGGGEGTATGDVAFTSTSGALSVEASAADGSDQFTLDTDEAKTTGQLLVVKNGGTARMTVSPTGFLELVDADENATDLSAASLNIYAPGLGTALEPAATDGSLPYLFGTTIAHTSGNLVEVKNNGTLKAAVDYAGRFIATPSTPANNATGAAGTITWDASFIYVWTAANTVKRAALSAF
jgi:hypothetical protein